MHTPQENKLFTLLSVLNTVRKLTTLVVFLLNLIDVKEMVDLLADILQRSLLETNFIEMERSVRVDNHSTFLTSVLDYFKGEKSC